ncbi:MAG: hypothetical protein Q7W13_05425 [Bacteroidia bacterium]|nr:hypothetical protein [Bacteroidia bacterium]
MSKSIIKNKNVLSIIASIVFFFILSTASQAQSNSNNPTIDKKYVRVDIGHGAMHCPFLSPKLEAKLREIKNIENFFIDKRNSYATFNLPSDTEMTSESLKKIGTDVGYPADDVVITINSKPIKVIAKQP